jgi:hypothetical protein
MDIAEKRSDLLHRISMLDDHRFEEIFDEMVAVLQHSKPYQLTDEENLAIDQALELDKKERRLTKSQVVAESRMKYPKLKFN